MTSVDYQDSELLEDFEDLFKLMFMTILREIKTIDYQDSEVYMDLEY